jgi:hypothetical protein
MAAVGFMACDLVRPCCIEIRFSVVNSSRRKHETPVTWFTLKFLFRVS